MPVRCQDTAKRVMGDHFEAFADIVTDSVGDYYRLYGEHAHAHEAWTRCSVIRDLIKERLTSYCERTQGLQVCREGNATFFGVGSEFLIRPKKLSDKLKANTGKTQFSFDFDRQVPVQLDLLDALDPTHVYLGYIPTENDPLSPPVYVVCNDQSGAVAWKIHLNEAPPTPPSELVPSISPSAPDTTPRRVRVKHNAKKAENE